MDSATTIVLVLFVVTSAFCGGFAFGWLVANAKPATPAEQFGELVAPEPLPTDLAQVAELPLPQVNVTINWDVLNAAARGSGMRLVADRDPRSVN